MFETGAGDAPVAVVSGNGNIPLQVVEAIEARGRKALVFAIRGEANAKLMARADVLIDWGKVGKLANSLKKHGCREVILIGGITRRPDYMSILGDWGTWVRLPEILKTMLGGDGSLLSKVIHMFESEGFSIIGVKDVAPEILAPEGALGTATPSNEALRDIELAKEATRLLGLVDAGQAAVAVKGRIVALEAAEGTDLMLERCAEVRRLGRVRAPERTGVLVKTVKPGQDQRVDLPAIGPNTIKNVVAAGLAGVAVQAGGAVIADFEETVAAADKAGVFIYGLPVPDEAAKVKGNV
ncbi:MAG: UDP-2,3-diacylglucosamine diphosphatase LpxI [Rhodobacteraceae bacterium]|nr:UDP-2,3-diacylglucosamine diphosphatase LpxI [Paracoccaceae bacterium]